MVHQEGLDSTTIPCDPTCGFNKLPCQNCASYAILQEQNIGGKLEHVWTIVDRSNPVEVQKIKTGTRNPFGWPFPLENHQDSSNKNATRSNFSPSTSFEGLLLDIKDDYSSENSATAPPLSRSETPESDLYDLSRGKPEPFQSIASQISANYHKERQNRHEKSGMKSSIDMSDKTSNQSVQEAVEEPTVSDDNKSACEGRSKSSTSSEIRRYVTENFETDQSFSNRATRCHRCNLLKFLEGESFELDGSGKPGICMCNSLPKTKKNDEDLFIPRGEKYVEFENLYDESQKSLINERDDTQEPRLPTADSSVLNVKGLLKPKSNRVGVLIADNREVKRVYFAPETENRDGRFSNILSVEASPYDTEDTPRPSRVTIWLTQGVIGIAAVIMTGALVFYLGSLVKTVIM